jgi:hypothetical protein
MRTILIVAAIAFGVTQDEEIEHARFQGVAVLNAGQDGPLQNIESGGKPLLSWRVKALPYHELQPLYKEFKLEEAWDSAHNKALLKVRNVYHTKHADDENSTTWKHLPTRPGGVMLVQGGKGSSVVWTQPDEVRIDPKKPLASFGAEPEGGWIVVLNNGRAQRMDAATLKKRLLSKE